MESAPTVNRPPPRQVRTGHDLRAESLLLLVVLTWAANYPVTKYGIAQLDIFVFNAIRYVVASLLLALLFRATRSTWAPVGAGDWLKLLRAGFIASVLYQIAFITGLSMTTAGNSAVLMATSPLWTVLISARMHREPVGRQLWIGMILSLAGVVMIIAGSGKKFAWGETDMLGDVICLGAAILWALNTNLQKPLLGRYSPIQLTLIMMTIGAVGLSLVALPAALKMSWTAVEWPRYGAAVWSGSFSIAIANIIWSTGVQRLGPGRTGSFQNLIPVVALVIAYFFLEEVPLKIQLAGTVVTLLGVWYARR